jgi:hypothetical protein
VGVLGVALIGASPAQADVGDGTATCVSGEICLNKDNPSGNYQRHFYNGGNDNGYWTNVSTSDQTTWYVHDSASSLRNRDTTCAVIEVNYSGTTVVNQQTFTRGASSFVGFTTAMNDKNDAHWRCSINGV